jgi:uncharacterized protein
VLTDAASNGLPGDHHFYISFGTRADGVRLSPRMLGQYPEEMTIVLQHQFWDLVVTEEGFEVGMSFGGIPERVAVPFAAIKGFLDPSVQFGLQFEEIKETAGDAVEDKGTGDDTSSRARDKASGAESSDKGRASSRPPAAHKGAAPVLATVPIPANPEPANSEPAKAPADEKADKPAGGGEVVRFDRFRKK